MSENLWIEKYKPKTKKELFGNYKAINTIEQWLKDFKIYKNKILKKNKEIKKNNHDNINKNKLNTDKKQKKNIIIKSSTKKKSNNHEFISSLIVVGNHGIGKTVAVDIIIKECGYNKRTIKFDNIKNTDNINTIVESFSNGDNILNLMNGNIISDNICIVIDEIESITSTTEKKVIKNFMKENNTNCYFPIIFISNNQHNKLKTIIKESCKEIRFFQPYKSDMEKILLKIIINEKMKISKRIVVDKILEHSQSDIRRLIYTLQDLYYSYGTTPIDENKINNYCKNSKIKDVDVNLTDATRKLLYTYKGIDDSLLLYETEKVLLPLMIHMNYCSHLTKNTNSKKNIFNSFMNIAESISIGDVVENDIYGNQNWSMQEIHGFHSCVATSYHINDYKIKNNTTYTPISFTSDINKTSIKKINKKNIFKTDKCFKNKTIYDYIFINKIIKELILNNKIEECVKLLIKYNIKLEYIESLLKIDKIKSTTNTLKSKQRKEFKKYIDKYEK